jgi:hypothetical protein
MAEKQVGSEDTVRLSVAYEDALEMRMRCVIRSCGW